MLTPLCQLACKYNCDKYGVKHSYTPWYFEQFQHRRETVRKVLEIGIGEGRSLFMWRDFFPNAMIYGADINADRVFWGDRITGILCDQTVGIELDMLIDRTGADLDLVIDDGSHKPEDQVYTCLALMPKLQPDVTYVIEDVIEPDLVVSLDDYVWEIPFLERRRRHDNRLVVVRHNGATP